MIENSEYQLIRYQASLDIFNDWSSENVFKTLVPKETFNDHL